MAFPLESDIADEQLDMDFLEPPRPTSRLGFNSELTPASPQPHRAAKRPRYTTSPTKWTKALLQRIGLSTTPGKTEITTLTTLENDPEDEDADPLSFATLPSLASSATSPSSLDCDKSFEQDDSDDSSSEDSDFDFDSFVDENDAEELDLFQLEPTSTICRPPSPPLPPRVNIPNKPPTKTSSLSASSPASTAENSYSPSPLSPMYTGRSSRTATKPFRHAYGNHGRSKYSLLHCKFLWAVREEQWEAHTARLRDAQAYSGLVLPKSTLRPPRSFPVSDPEPAPIPPMTIHPRHGDLSALHDPQATHLDRCFVGMQPWTISKTLWMYDVHLWAAWQANHDDGIDFDDDVSENESMAASISSASDDSDSTLVDETQDETMVDISLSNEEEHPQLKKFIVTRPDPFGVGWETSWAKRWELLIELVRIDTERERQQAEILQKIQPQPNKRPKFFIGDDDESDDQDGMMLF
ncbi:NCS cytosine-purine permease [Mycena indigotica]|uniref:NCS cytosine-purine permease n=1 Tax=Mycena indigotica TaxID=2126181 RepID=A0A8H6TD55_9AGAR|nr:NCS cytosine-purine permease [Mycena indigotica]KAF7316408.1 NCS cytosine-purine permease [Mycena indigotica]